MQKPKMARQFSYQQTASRTERAKNRIYTVSQLYRYSCVIAVPVPIRDTDVSRVPGYSCDTAVCVYRTRLDSTARTRCAASSARGQSAPAAGRCGLVC